MIDALWQLLIYVVILGFVYWGLGFVPLPDPFGRIARAVVMVLLALVVVYFLIQLSHTHLSLN